MTNPQEIAFEQATPRLAGLHWQGKEGPRILALHGWLDNAASFHQIANYLNYSELFALDFPGHGRSGHSGPGATYHFVDWVYSVCQMIDQLPKDDRPLDLVSHSMGAAVSMMFCAVFPQRVRRLVLIEGLAPLTEEPDRTPDRLSRHLQSRLRAERDPRPYPSIDAALEMRLKATPMSRDGAKNIVERSLREISGGFTWSSDRRLTLPSAVRMTEAQVLAFLRRVTCPTLIIKATGGLNFDPALEKRLLEALPEASATLETIDGGHHIHCDAPQACSEVINAFLKK